MGYWLHALPELYFQKAKKVSVAVWTLQLFPVWLPGPCGIVLKNYPLHAEMNVPIPHWCKYFDLTPPPPLCVYRSGGYSTAACVHLPVSGPHRWRLHSEVSAAAEGKSQSLG